MYKYISQEGILRDYYKLKYVNTCFKLNFINNIIIVSIVNSLFQSFNEKKKNNFIINSMLYQNYI